MPRPLAPPDHFHPETGIALEEIITLPANPDARGTLAEAETHKRNEQLVIALE
jgi:hypothetical protein